MKKSKGWKGKAIWFTKVNGVVFAFNTVKEAEMFADKGAMIYSSMFYGTDCYERVAKGVH